MGSWRQAGRKAVAGMRHFNCLNNRGDHIPAGDHGTGRPRPGPAATGPLPVDIDPPPPYAAAQATRTLAPPIRPVRVSGAALFLPAGIHDAVHAYSIAAVPAFVKAGREPRPPKHPEFPMTTAASCR